MLTRLILAAALAAFATAASAAEPVRPAYLPSGYAQMPAGDLGLALGTLQMPGSGLGLFASAARVNLPVAANWNVEAEANAKAYTVGGVTALPLYLDGYLHVWNGMGTMAWGAFGGASHQLGLLASSVGGEFKSFMGNLSIGGALALTTISATTAWTVNASANAYINPNDRIGINAVWMTIGSTNVWEVSVDAEHRFAQPASLWVSASTLNSSGGGSNVWSVLGGFRFYLDAPGSTQQSHEIQVPFTFRLPLMLGSP
jgi:hypothetical protein